MTNTHKHQENTQQQIDIPVTINREAVAQSFKAERTRPMMLKYMDEIIPMAQKAVSVKALYRVVCVTDRGDDWVEIENVRFNSKVLTKNLEKVDTVFISLMTSGTELDNLPVSSKDIMKYLCLEAIKTNVLFQAGEYMINFIKNKFSLPDVTHLHPGEFADLGIEQQIPLYSLFDDAEKAIGVKLTPNKTLSPLKSASSIMFYNGPSFQSCELCLQANCAGRRAAFNPRLAEKFGLKTKNKETA